MNTKKKLVFLILLFLSLNLVALPKFIEREKRVLFLFSGSHEFMINRKVFVALEKELKENKIKVLSEYIGDNNSVYNNNKEVFLNFYKEKYGANNKFDLVLAYNNKAIELCQEYGEELFPASPILKLDTYKQKSIIIALEKQLKMIRELHPKLEHLLIVTDNSQKGQFLGDYLASYIDSTSLLKKEGIFIDFGKIPFSDIVQYEYYSQKNSVIFLLSCYQDKTKHHLDFPGQLEFLQESLGLPIYSFYEKSESGVIGGYYSDFSSLAQDLSIKIMLILNKMPLNEIDFSDLEVYRLYLNEKNAKANHIDIEAYYNEAEILGSEVLSKERKEVIFKYFFAGLSIVLFIHLLFFYYKKRKYKKDFFRVKNILSALSNMTYQYILVVEKETGVIIDYNKKVANSNFTDYIQKSETKIKELFSEEILVAIADEKENFFKLYEFYFNANNISFPAKTTLLSYSDGKKEYVIIQFIDISEFKHELIQLNKKAEDADRKVFETKNLIEGFVREIRDPLNVKKGFEDLLAKGKLSRMQEMEYEQIKENNVHKLLRLVEKVLIFSEIRKETRVLNNQEFCVNECIRSIILAVQKETARERKDVRISSYFSVSDHKDVIFTDKEYFCLIFREILENAVKFTHKGLIECGYTHPNEGKIIFYVKDNGVGMDGEEQHNAFEKYNNSQDSSFKTQESGIGIGLSICRNLIKKMGGNIWLTSSKGKGTTVYFYLEFDMSIFKDIKNNLSNNSIEELKKMKICIIDEDLGSQKYLRNLLFEYGLEARLMPNFRFYTKYLDSHASCSLMILDYESGFKDFFSKEKDSLKDTILLIMTRTILDEEMIAYLQGYKYLIIYKPLKMQDVINALIVSSKKTNIKN